MIKFLIIIDTKINYLSEIEEALYRQKEIYKVNGVNIEYETRMQDLSGVPWLTNPDIVSYSWIREQTAKLKPNTAYSVVYVFHSENWKAPGIGGWHMSKYNGYQVQLINGVQGNVPWLTKVFMMEGMHSWDTPIADKLGISLSQYLGVNDYDNDLVHGMYHQGVVLSQEDSIRIFGQEYIKYDYSLLIKKIAPLINKALLGKKMYKHIIYNGTEQYIRGEDGKDYHIYNVHILEALKKMGILSSAEPEFVDSINDSGIDIVCLNKE